MTSESKGWTAVNLTGRTPLRTLSFLALIHLSSTGAVAPVEAGDR